jgi:AraC-like DNA-binding protein
MDEPAAIAPVRITTAAFPENKRLAMWREVYGRYMTHVDIEPIDDRPFHASVAFHALPGLNIAIGSRSDARYHIGKNGAGRTQDNVVLSYATRGRGHIAQLGREVAGGPGGAVLLYGTEPATSTLLGDGAFVTLSFPRHSIQAHIPDLDAIMVRPFNEDNQALRLLSSYLGVLSEHDCSWAPSVARSVATHIFDLVVLAAGVSGEARQIVRERGAKAAWRRAIIGEIFASAPMPDLSPHTIACKLGISERYVRLILSETGRSFTELVLTRRLDIAHHRLSDPQSDRCTIAGIAFAAGFSDISHFNRRFRGRFGLTPTDVRVGRQPYPTGLSAGEGRSQERASPCAATRS